MTDGSNLSGYPTHAQMARAFRELANDLDKVDEEGFLASVRPYAVLTNWSLITEDAVCLVGDVEGHPDLEDGRVTTAQVFYCNLDAGLARTYFGWFRFEGPPAAAAAR